MLFHPPLPQWPWVLPFLRSPVSCPPLYDATYLQLLSSADRCTDVLLVHSLTVLSRASSSWHPWRPPRWTLFCISLCFPIRLRLKISCSFFLSQLTCRHCVGFRNYTLMVIQLVNKLIVLLPVKPKAYPHAFILNLFSLFYTFILWSSKFYFNIIFRYISKSHKWPIPFRFSEQNTGVLTHFQAQQCSVVRFIINFFLGKKDKGLVLLSELKVRIIHSDGSAPKNIQA